MTTNTKNCNDAVVHTQTCGNSYLIVLVIFILLAIILGSYFAF